ncbi:trimeric intracellular cation channel family protein [Streptomyces sulfonofaciens]|uniref:trimeric intracellular cation channel family protein n=1 Tax=Streptomyces sulfonofaciens TaxID=68272 RepID=UPI001671D5AD
MIEVLQLVAVGVFATSGALVALRSQLDVFGVTTVLGGGVIRDIMLGVHPPTVFERWPFLVVRPSSLFRSSGAIPKPHGSDRRC